MSVGGPVKMTPEKSAWPTARIPRGKVGLKAVPTTVYFVSPHKQQKGTNSVYPQGPAPEKGHSVVSPPMEVLQSCLLQTTDQKHN